MTYNSSMTDVWYPGRPPLKTPEIVEGLTHYLGALQVCADQCTSAYLEQAEQICDLVMDILQEESDDCLGSDSDINALIELLPQSFHAAVLCVKHGRWDDMEDVINSVDAVKWSLIYKLDAITEGGDDERRTTPPEASGRTTCWPNGGEDPEQEHWAQGPTPDQLEAEEALPSRDEEEDGLATETDILSPAAETLPSPSPASDEEEPGRSHTA
jgi:hypothetical protein